MWKTAENGDSVKPSEIDRTSSSVYVYVRKDFEELPSYDIDGEQVGTHWRWLETTIPVEDWDMYTKVITNESDLTDVQLALCELYEMIGG